MKVLQYCFGVCLWQRSSWAHHIADMLSSFNEIFHRFLRARANSSNSSVSKVIIFVKRQKWKCFAFYRSYSTALVSVCDSGLAGLIILLISSAISGFLFTTLVWCNSHTWIYFKHKGRYIKVSLICLHLHRQGEKGRVNKFCTLIYCIPPFTFSLDT